MAARALSASSASTSFLAKEGWSEGASADLFLEISAMVRRIAWSARTCLLNRTTTALFERGVVIRMKTLNKTVASLVLEWFGFYQGQS